MTSARSRPRQDFVERILDSTGTDSDGVPQPALILMAGLPGSGKSTFARRLAAVTGATLLESDAIRQMLFGGPTHELAESRALFAAIFAATEQLLRDGRSVIVDATNLKRSDRLPAHEIVRATGASLFILHTTAPESVVLERLSRREAAPEPDDHSLAGVAVYRHMAEDVEPLVEEHWQIDTSDEQATQAVLVRLIEELKLAGATRAVAGHVIGGSNS